MHDLGYGAATGVNDLGAASLGMAADTASTGQKHVGPGFTTHVCHNQPILAVMHGVTVDTRAGHLGQDRISWQLHGKNQPGQPSQPDPTETPSFPFTINSQMVSHTLPLNKKPQSVNFISNYHAPGTILPRPLMDEPDEKGILEANDSPLTANNQPLILYNRLVPA
ncbi:MAG: hypothetical protein OEV91_02635 [Desulfobulbaceae bacterium]|nr:hypothetical protein [Desulfobulbaceae bacterium]